MVWFWGAAAGELLPACAKENGGAINR
ncbi:hypothetical protein SBA7_1190005 [Candidatus Sulfotelmatobacter sp. SbA7]|nr:hypothetical protein SBA7_1190005 [Candidatus Sulfotelmatobacter sp. SbA7]